MGYNVERVYRFMYQGSLVNENSDTEKEITEKYRMQISVTVDCKDTLTFIVLKFTGKCPSMPYAGSLLSRNLNVHAKPEGLRP
jgi:hypothetical protein